MPYQKIGGLIEALFEAKRLVTRVDMMEVAEVSLATFKRDIAKLRDQMGMPILFDKDRADYYLDRNNLSTEIPGLWFNPEELVALLSIQRLIEQLEPGLVGLKLRPLQKKLTDLLEAKGLGEAEIAKRVRMTIGQNSKWRRSSEKGFNDAVPCNVTRQRGFWRLAVQSGALPCSLAICRAPWLLGVNTNALVRRVRPKATSSELSVYFRDA